ncbi:MAG: outer membrane protein assembly factor BamE [Pseudomonadota bacterium]|nr:outer membrane protein assembly factor BamE [Pseudomonadota bacterium]
MKTGFEVALRWSGALLLATAAASCALLRSPASLAPGTPIAAARQTFGAGDKYPLPDGATRLAFRRGRDTYMVDFDAGGRLVRSQQVLTPSTFATIQPGMSQTEVLTRLGRPAFVFPVGYQKLQVWNYRFGGPEGDCMVFQVSIGNATGTVSEAGTGPDPECSRGDSAKD